MVNEKSYALDFIDFLSYRNARNSRDLYLFIGKTCKSVTSRQHAYSKINMFSFCKIQKTKDGEEETVAIKNENAKINNNLI